MRKPTIPKTRGFCCFSIVVAAVTSTSCVVPSTALHPPVLTSWPTSASTPVERNSWITTKGWRTVRFVQHAPHTANGWNASQLQVVSTFDGTKLFTCYHFMDEQLGDVHASFARVQLRWWIFWCEIFSMVRTCGNTRKPRYSRWKVHVHTCIFRMLNISPHMVSSYGDLSSPMNGRLWNYEISTALYSTIDFLCLFRPASVPTTSLASSRISEESSRKLLRSLSRNPKGL